MIAAIIGSTARRRSRATAKSAASSSEPASSRAHSPPRAWPRTRRRGGAWVLATVDDLFAQSGVVRTDTVAELFDAAALLAVATAKRIRVGIVTNGQGLGILCGDACRAAGLDVVPMPDATRRALRRRPSGHRRRRQSRRPPGGRVAQQFADAIDAWRPAARWTRSSSSTSAARHRSRRRSRPRCAPPRSGPCFRSSRSSRCRSAWAFDGRPCFRFPEDAARALGRAARYGRLARDGDRDRPRPRGRRRRGRGDHRAGARRGPGWLAPEEASDVAGLLRHPQPAPASSCATPPMRWRSPARWRLPVALKGVAEGLVHRSDAGAVTLGLTRRAHDRARRRGHGRAHARRPGTR